MMRVQLDDGAFAPERAYRTDAGLDIKSPYNTIVPARGSATIDTGVHIELPPNTVGLLKSKSGLNVRANIVSEGVIDEGYDGSIVVKLYNHGDTDYQVMRGDKISQLLVMECKHPEIQVVLQIKGLDRGSKGFGSTGR